MKSFKSFSEAYVGQPVNSADRKPEKYIDANGKTRIRMVPAKRNLTKESTQHDYFKPAHPMLKKDLGVHGDHAIGMAGSDKGIAVKFDRPKNVEELRKQMSKHGFKSVTQVQTADHKNVYHFNE